MSVLFIFMLFIIFLLILLIWFIFRLYKEESTTEVFSYDFSNNMNRTQRKLFEKQITNFKKTFNSFSNYQLSVIRELIDQIIKERS